MNNREAMQEAFEEKFPSFANRLKAGNQSALQDDKAIEAYIMFEAGFNTTLAHERSEKSQAQQTESQWISVDKCLPDGDRFVDVFVKSRSNLAYGRRFTEFRFINGKFDVSSLPSACYVTHWMYIPPAPEGGV